jgi:hypothetical protein
MYLSGAFPRPGAFPASFLVMMIAAAYGIFAGLKQSKFGIIRSIAIGYVPAFLLAVIAFRSLTDPPA